MGKEWTVNRIRYHIPKHIKVPRPDPKDFETTKELLDFEETKFYTTINGFNKFVMSENHLIISCNAGFVWHIIGTITNPEDIELPQWKGPKYRMLLRNDKRLVIRSEDIESMLNGKVRLNDGRTGILL